MIYEIILGSKNQKNMKVPGIIQKTTIRDKKTLMVYISAFFFMFAYTILAYSIASFLIKRFPDNPKAIIFVGFILGIASFFAIFVDSLWNYLQKIRPPRTLTLWALGGVITTVAIFFLANFGAFSVLRWTSFTFLAAFLYGWSFDLYDVTVTTTIIGNSSSDNLAQNISQKKVAEALGMVSGLVLAGILVYFGESFTQFVLIIFLILVAIFFAHHFDREEDEKEALEFADYALVDWKAVFMHIHDVEKTKELIAASPAALKENVLALAHKTAANVKKLPAEALEVSRTVLEVSRKELIEILAREGEIVQKEAPKRPVFSFRDMLGEVKTSFAAFFRIFTVKGFRAPVFWATICVMLFSFWDTMAITYQPLFLQEFAKSNPSVKMLGGFLMVLFIFPVFLFQIPFSKIADKIGREKMIIAGLLVSGISVIILSTTDSLLILIAAGMGSGLGYAAAFSPAQAMFVAEMKAPSEQKTAASEGGDAGSLRIALNMGNIFGQFLGGTIFALLGFAGGFFVFGFLFFAMAVISLIFYLKIRPQKPSESLQV